MRMIEATDRYRVQVRHYVETLGDTRIATKHFCSQDCREEFVEVYPDENIVLVLDPDDPSPSHPDSELK